MERTSAAAGGQAKKTVRELQDQAPETGEQLRDKTQEIWKEANHYVRQNPGVAVGIAVAAGAVLGGFLINAISQPAQPSTLDSAKESMAEKLAQLRDVLDGAIRKLK